MKGILRKTWASAALLLFTLCANPSTPAQSAPFALLGTPGDIAGHVLPIGGCREGCDDCNDCPTEVDVAPPAQDDLIAREIERFGPAPIADPCETRNVVTKGRRAALDYGSCGIRCWYWRLRNGYCGPGCEYYKYRLHHYGKNEPPFRHPRYVCGS